MVGLKPMLGALGIVKTDIPFARDDANRFLPWVLALMVALTAFSMCIGLTLGQWVSSHKLAFSGSVTVIVPPQPETMEKDVENLLSYLRKQPIIESLKVLDKKEVTELLEPWLGDVAEMEELPLPTVAQATLKPDANGQIPSLTELQDKLTSLVAGTEIDAHETWVEKFARFTNAIQLLSYTAALFILTALAAMVVFTAKAALKLHRRTVALLHSIGADDPYIARQFQWNACGIALQGAIPGTLLGALLYGSLAFYAGSLESPLMPKLVFLPWHYVLLVLLPLFCGLLSLVAARMAVLKQLRRVL